MTKKRKIVKVIWNDAVARAGWELRKTLKSLTPPRCVSVGFLISKNKKYVTLAQNFSKADVGEQISIPRAMIKKIKKL